VQSHTLDTPANDAIRASRGSAEAYDGITEVWFEDLSALGATTEEAAATTELAARVLRQTGSQELPPRRPRISVPLARMEEGDLDLPARA